MTRTLDQIMAEESLSVAPHMIQTRDAVIAVGDSWVVNEYHWPSNARGWYGGPSAVAIAVLVGAIWLLALPIPPHMPWLIPVTFGALIGAVWSIGWSVWDRWFAPRTPEYPSRGITFSIAGSEGAVTIFQSEDEKEIKLVRQKLEQTLTPGAIVAGAEAL